MSRRVCVVPHSHWDREWYSSFEAYRNRLVKLMDDLLALLEADPHFAHFHLDGQVALVDDYLEVRPDATSRLRRFADDGRLAMGPWYVLMDEFCVSAETIVRNLQLGLARSASYGAQPETSYLPDMFGHIAQMPQILRQAGFERSVVWRGVPSSVTRTGFRWQSPDGSSVRAEYMPVGYSSGAFLPPDAHALVNRIAAFEEEIGGYLEDGWPILLTNGGDHLLPQHGLPEVLAAANRIQDRFGFEHTSIDAFTASAPVDGLATHVGEMRSGHRSPVLPGVFSNRVDVKVASAKTETLLERVAEPLTTLWLPAQLWPAADFARAWLEVIRNSAHDSICACSADEVGRSVLSRFDTATAIGEGLTDAAAELAAAAAGEAGVIVLNPLPLDRSGLVEIDLPGSAAPPGTQQVWSQEAGETTRRGVGRDLATIKGALTGEGWLRQNSRGERLSVDDGPEPHGLTITMINDPSTTHLDRSSPAAGAEAWTLAGAGAGRPLTVKVERKAAQRVLARVDVPGWGWATLGRAGSEVADPVTAARKADGDVSLANEQLTVTVDRSDGTFGLHGPAGVRAAGLNRIAEEPDAGDTYNFDAATPDVRPTDAPKSVDVDLVETGPLRAIARVRRVYRWSGDTEMEVTSDIEVRAGEQVVRVTTSFEHHGGDRRVRAHFPLPEPAETTDAECAFAVVTRRNSEAEGGRQEPAVTTFPSRRFVTAGDLTVTHEGLLEYELKDDGGELALTLLRATGVISKPNPTSRPVAAGPPVPTRDTQMPGPQTLRYAVAARCEDPWALADDVWTPLVTRPTVGGGELPPSGRRLSVSGARVSALHRSGDGAVELRVFNPTADPTEVTVPGHTGTLVDLRGKSLDRWEESFALAPWAFATARLEATNLD